MRGPGNEGMLAELEQTMVGLAMHVEAIDDLLRCQGGQDLDAASREKLSALGPALETLGERAARAASLIDRTPSISDGPSPGWDLERFLVQDMFACRGRSIKRLGDVAPGTTFVIDDYWRGENGVLIGVVWETPSRPFEWLSPLELKTCTRPIEG